MLGFKMPKVSIAIEMFQNSAIRKVILLSIDKTTIFFILRQETYLQIAQQNNTIQSYNLLPQSALHEIRLGC